MNKFVPILLVGVLVVSGCTQTQIIIGSDYVADYTIEILASHSEIQSYASTIKKYEKYYREDIYSNGKIIKTLVSNDFGIFDCMYLDPHPLCFYAGNESEFNLSDILELWETYGVLNKQITTKTVDVNGVHMMCENTETFLDLSKLTAESFQPIIDSFDEYFIGLEGVADEAVKLLENIKEIRKSECKNDEIVLEFISLVKYTENGEEITIEKIKSAVNINLNPEFSPSEFDLPEEAEILL